MFDSDRWRLPQTFLSFLKKLLAAHWRSLLMLSLGVCLPLLIFEELSLVVLQEQGGFPWDEPILLAIHTTAKPQLDTFAATLTKFGVFWGCSPLPLPSG